jgi:glycosidase
METSSNRVLIETKAPLSLELASVQPRGPVHPSPADWGDQIVYFLLPDRFSDGREDLHPLFDRSNTGQFAARDRHEWMDAGKRFTGGTIKGIEKHLPYVRSLGATTIWIGPIWKQRADLQTYHGYGIQNFLDVDPRFGTRQDLRDLVDAAHALGMYVLLDVIYNHTGNNWYYDDNGSPREIMPFRREPYPLHGWRSRESASIAQCHDLEDGVWPIELQNPDWYSRQGAIQNWDEPGKELHREAEFRRGDFCSLKDLKLETSDVLAAMVHCYQYWIALSDCDGFRVDTVKHVAPEISAIFCHDVRTFARRLGKQNFLLLGEVTGCASIARNYLDPDGPNLDSVLDIESAPRRLADFVKGLSSPQDFFDHFGGRDALGDVRAIGRHHVSVLDDHDMVCRQHKQRFACEVNSCDAATQTAHAVGVQLTTPGIPCIYYGTEQGFCGSESMHDESHEPRDKQAKVPEADRYIRECMFAGPFGAFGTQGCHFFDPNHPAYLRIAAIARIRQSDDLPGRALRAGALYVREVRHGGDEFRVSKAGELVAWSRVAEKGSVIVALNTHGSEPRGGDVTVDSSLHPCGSNLRVLYRGDWPDEQLRSPPTDETVEVQSLEDGRCFVRIDLPPAGMMILT